MSKRLKTQLASVQAQNDGLCELVQELVGVDEPPSANWHKRAQVMMVWDMPPEWWSARWPVLAGMVRKYSARGKPNECWRWLRAHNEWGYGIQRLSRSEFDPAKTMIVTRVLMMLRVDRELRPDDEYALHSCDHPWCVNPAHLRIGTMQDNADDRVLRGRSKGFTRKRHHEGDD